MAALPYLHPALYYIFLFTLHRKTLIRRYKFVAKEVGDNKLVFELGCGPGFLVEYLDKTCTYIGWDMNKKFVKHGLSRGRNLELKNIFNFADYPKNDVCVIVDVLHHITPNEKTIVKNTLRKTKKLIVIEPYRAFNFPLPRLVRKYYDRALGDWDGINPYARREKWDYSNDGLKEYFTELGANKVTDMGKDVMAVFQSLQDNQNMLIKR